MEYRISVLMGIYNCAPTLKEALDSLLAQTYQGFKVIMCDDGSSDNTYEVAKAYADKYENFILVKNDKNMGLNYTLNHCLSLADTEFCARMDGDDLSLPSRFEKEIKFLDAHPEYAMVSTPMIHFDENGEFGRGKVDEGEPSKSKFNYGSPFCHAPCMVRKEAYDKVEGYTVDPKLLRVEDYHLWMKMYAVGCKGYNLGEHLYMMRDDRNAFARRNVKARMNGIYAHWLAYKTLHLSFLGFVKYAIGNIIRAYAPTFIYNYFHKKRIKGQE